MNDSSSLPLSLPANTRAQTRRRDRWLRWLGVVLGIVAGQAVLFGPSLIGAKVLLPVDLLAQTNWYLPQTAETRAVVPHDVIMSDAVLDIEMLRQFTGAELRAFRLPFWCPYRYAGAPSYRASFSPPCWLGYLFAAPQVLAYVQLCLALTAGVGFYVFSRRVLAVRYWPAALGAWCYPLTGTFIVWQGYGPPPVVCWLPWILLAADATLRHPTGWSGPALALTTAVVMVSGQTDVAGQVLLACGLFVVWRYFQHVRRRWFAWNKLARLSVPAVAWLLGIMASAWLLFPLMEYTGGGSRISRRSQGEEERPPMGLTALAQIVTPEAWGLTQDGSFYLLNGNVPESAAGGYAGMLALFVAAPLACARRRRWPLAAIWTLLAVLGLAWSVNLPGVISLLRLPGLNLMSHNRYVFLTSFSILALAVLGFDNLWRRVVWRRWQCLAPMLLLCGLGAWFASRADELPEPLASQLLAAVNNGREIGGVRDAACVLRIQRNYVATNVVAAGLAAAALACWTWLLLRRRGTPTLAAALGGLLVVELLWFAVGRSAQCDPAMYYPPIPALVQAAHDDPGRFIAFNCFPANLGQTHGLFDVRGYDGVDPLRYVQLLVQTADPRSSTLPYALVQWLLPRVEVTPPDQLRLSPILDMLGVRYVVFRGPIPPGITPAYQSPDYWVMRNRRALHRVFVPRRVEVIADAAERLRRLAAPDFNPLQVAVVETPVDLPENCHGEASIVERFPADVTVRVDMFTPGLVVLAAAWDPGWKAFLDGVPAPLLCTNHALRGVVVPMGRHSVAFRYEPDSLRRGGLVALLAASLWFAWLGAVWAPWRRFHKDAA